MKRIYNDTKSKPEKAIYQHLEVYYNRKILSEKYESDIKSAKFNTYGVKNM